MSGYRVKARVSPGSYRLPLVYSDFQKALPQIQSRRDPTPSLIRPLTSLFSFLFCNITILFLSNKAEKEDYGIRLIFSRGCWRRFSTFFVGAGCDRGMVILVMYLIAVAVLCGYQIGEPNIIERELYLNRGD